jgi:hypothetical protein
MSWVLNPGQRNEMPVSEYKLKLSSDAFNTSCVLNVWDHVSCIC